MSAVQAHPFGDGLVVNRGADAPLLLLDAAGRAIWQALAAGTPPAVLASALPDAARQVAEIAAARVPPPQATAMPPPPLRRAWRSHVRIYALAGVPVALDSADRELEALLHPRFAHAETGGQPAATLRLRRSRGGFALLEEGRAPEHHARAEALAGAVVRRVAELSYGSADWSAVLHAAGVADGLGGAIVLPGACGRGKSTLTAALAGAGLAYLSDDCVPLDAGGRAVAVPFGICLKQAGWAAGEAALPASAAAPVFVCQERGPCRYVPPPQVARGRLPLSAFVFPSFEPGARPALVPMRPEETLAALVAGRAWLARSWAGLPTALRVIERTPAWRLAYGATADGVAAVTSLVARRRAAE